MKLKQKHISRKIGISEGMLSMILSGQRGISYRMSKRLKQLTKIDEVFWMEATPKEVRRALSLLED